MKFLSLEGDDIHTWNQYWERLRENVVVWKYAAEDRRFSCGQFVDRIRSTPRVRDGSERDGM
jgi:myo-inositol-hexaphosphate 3-phosphohydrolase